MKAASNEIARRFGAIVIKRDTDDRQRQAQSRRVKIKNLHFPAMPRQGPGRISASFRRAREAAERLSRGSADAPCRRFSRTAAVTASAPSAIFEAPICSTCAISQPNLRGRVHRSFGNRRVPRSGRSWLRSDRCAGPGASRCRWPV